ncbi:MAG: DUF1501 domain-containing protein [Planctomycetota bacterium]|nr:DUF1501 domain-containing protein [Planctomycetota bacterium]
MKRSPNCGTVDHGLSRRSFMGGLAAGTALGIPALYPKLGSSTGAMVNRLAQSQKRVLMVYLSGGVSQLETWDPKPGAKTGGPFRAIPTSVPGVHLSELLPHTASQMHRLALVRGINTAEDDHGKGSQIMHTGRKEEPGIQYPHLGSICSKLLGPDAGPLPGYLHVTPGGGGGSSPQDAAFLGPKFGPVGISDGKAPLNIDRPGGELRKMADERFLAKRRTARTEAYTQTFDQAKGLMSKKGLFDIVGEPSRLLDSYGRHDFGRHCLLSRRLLEGGATFVKVTHTNYDTHHENFDFHLEQLGEFDRSFATLIDDLHQRGILSSTLVMVISEFGRTPNINHLYGRDHWSKAWSVALGGCGIVGGGVVGKTNGQGTAVVDREVHGGHLFHTYLQALGLDSKKNHYVDQRPIPMADPKAEAIREILA